MEKNYSEPEKTRWWAVLFAVAVTAAIAFGALQWYQYQIPRNNFQEGIAGIREGNWDLVQLQTTALTGNKRFEAHRDYLEAAMEINQGDLESAESLLVKPLKHKELRAYALAAEAIIALRRGDLETANIKTDEALEIDPELPEAQELSRSLEGIGEPMARVARAMQAIDAGDLATVQNEIKALKSMTIGDPYAKFIAGVVLMRDNKYTAALDAFGVAVNSGDLAPQTLTLSGEALVYLNRPADAVNLFLQALQLDDKQVDAHRWLATLYYDNGATDHAAAHLRRIVELDQTDYRPYRLLGLMNKDFEDYDEALVQYNAAIEHQPPVLVRAEIFLEKAQCLAKLRRYAEALQTLEEPILAQIQDPAFVNSVKNTKAECLLDDGKPEQAEKLIDEVLAQEPTNRSALVLKGTIFQVNNQFPQATEVLKQAVAADPYDYTAHFKLAQVYQAQGNTQLAKSTLAKADELKALREKFSELHALAAAELDNAEVRFEMGQTALQLGRPDLAMVWFSSVLALEPENAQAKAKLNEVRQQLGVQPAQPMQPGPTTPNM